MTTDPIDVDLRLGYSYSRTHMYDVVVDGRVYDQFTSRRRLSWAEERDVVSGYREALSGGSDSPT